jgi:sortase (surface protein transpeptidase)
MEDAETGEQLYVDTHDKVFRRRFQEAAQKREAALTNAFNRAGVDVLSLSTEDDLVSAIMRFASLRQRRRKHSSSGL